MNQVEEEGSGAGQVICHLLTVKLCRIRVDMGQHLGIIVMVDR